MSIAVGVGLDDSGWDQSGVIGFEVLTLNLARKLLPTDAPGAQSSATDAQ